MGSNLAYDLANDELNLGLERAIGMHLQGNHYPPVPLAMVQPCIDAIDAYHDEDYQRLIDLPAPITWRDQNKAPASAIVEAHHLDAWLPHEYGVCECQDCLDEYNRNSCEHDADCVCD